MLRFAVVALLALSSIATRADAQAEARVGMGIGPAVWLEIGEGGCGVVNDDATCTKSGLRRVIPGALAAFDVEVLHWLRLGLAVGIGVSPTRYSDDQSGRTATTHYFMPITLHSYWRVEIGKHATLWGGPEVGMGVYLMSRTRTTYPQFVGATPRAQRETENSTRQAFMAGLAVGLDVLLVRRLRIGVEVGEAVAVRGPERRNEDDSHLLSMTRFAFVLRYL